MRHIERAKVRVAARWVAVFGVFLALGLAWAVSNPPGAAPDEASHYVRLLGLAEGDVLGDPLPDSYLLDRGFVPGIKLRHFQQESGVYQVSGMAPPPDFCTRFHPSRPWTCSPPPVVSGRIAAVSFHAPTPIGSYVLPAATASFGSSTNAKMLLGRVAYAVQDAMLLVLIVGAIRLFAVRPKAVSIAALALCFTPLLAFETGTLAPNGTETLAVVAATAWLLAALRTSRARDLWVAVGLGCAACLMRDVAFLFVLVSIVLVAIATPRALATWQRLPLRGRRWAAAMQATAVVWGLAWFEWRAGRLGTVDHSVSNLRAQLSALWRLLLHSVSLVGSLDVKLDDWTSVVWWVLFAATVGLTTRARRAWGVVAAGCVAWVGLNVALSLASQAVGFGVQARYTLFLPAVVVLCVVAGPTRRLSVAAERGILLAVAAFVSAMQFATLLINAERHATGLTSRPMSFSNAVWSPRVGWPVALTLCFVASAALGLLVVVGGWGSPHDGYVATTAESDGASAEGVGQ